METQKSARGTGGRRPQYLISKSYNGARGEHNLGGVQVLCARLVPAMIRFCSTVEKHPIRIDIGHKCGACRSRFSMRIYIKLRSKGWSYCRSESAFLGQLGTTHAILCSNSRGWIPGAPFKARSSHHAAKMCKPKDILSNGVNSTDADEH